MSSVILNKNLFIWIVILLFFSCKNNKEYYKIKTFSINNNVNAIIEIPGGTKNMSMTKTNF